MLKQIHYLGTMVNRNSWGDPRMQLTPPSHTFVI